MRFLAVFTIFGLLVGMGGCVPKTQFQSQNQQLAEANATISELQEAQRDCDPDSFLELQEQVQNLDLLQQELIDRNTSLAEEVARLRIYEAQVKAGEVSCDQREKEVREDYEARLSRTRETYEDLIEDLKKQIEELRSSN